VVDMNILTSIRSFLEQDFGTFFCDFKEAEKSPFLLRLDLFQMHI